MINLVEGLTFDDVLLVPTYSEVKSRSNIDLTVKLSKGLSFKHPLIPANMKTLTGVKMAEEIYKSGGMAIIHRFMPQDEQVHIAKNYSWPRTLIGEPKNEIDKLNYIGFSVGVKENDYTYVDRFVKSGAKILCIDIAHGDSEHCIAMTKYISEKYPEIFLIAGNVATADGAKRLWMAGADCVKVGIGPGSLCTTRVETGNGVPQLTALADIAEEKKLLTTPYKEYNDMGECTKVFPQGKAQKQIFIIADGGIKNAGDATKALCFADMVMIGNVFAGTDETPGDICQVDGKRYKNYVGSSTYKTSHVEGVMALVPTKGPVKNIMDRLCEGIKSGCSYQGCYNLIDLKKDPRFVRITNAGIKESNAHDVIIA